MKTESPKGLASPLFFEVNLRSLLVFFQQLAGFFWGRVLTATLLFASHSALVTRAATKRGTQPRDFQTMSSSSTQAISALEAQVNLLLS